VPGGEHGYVTFEIPAFVECDPHAFRRHSKLARFTVNDLQRAGLVRLSKIRRD
jgi:hypothetical protein